MLTVNSIRTIANFKVHLTSHGNTNAMLLLLEIEKRAMHIASYEQACNEYFGENMHSTTFLRDELCEPFKKLFTRELEYDNAWFSLDTASLSYR